MEIFINIYNKYKVLVIIIMISILLVLGVCFFISNQSETEEEIVEHIEFKEQTMVETNKLIKVNIKGAVKNPGVYELESDSRVEDAIDKSGGLSEDADTSIINLSKKLEDESVIIVYTKDEVKKIKSGNVVIQYIEKECNCPSFENSACIDPDSLISNESIDSNKDKNTKISINNASIKELQMLTGIGEAKAKAIIEYRTTNGKFKNIEEIKNVKGIGDAVFNKIKEHITI